MTFDWQILSAVLGTGGFVTLVRALVVGRQERRKLEAEVDELRAKARGSDADSVRLLVESAAKSVALSAQTRDDAVSALVQQRDDLLRSVGQLEARVQAVESALLAERRSLQTLLDRMGEVRDELRGKCDISEALFERITRGVIPEPTEAGGS